MPDSGGQTNVQISGKAALFVGKHGSATVMLEPVWEKVGFGEAVVIPWSALLSGRRADVEG